MPFRRRSNDDDGQCNDDDVDDNGDGGDDDDTYQRKLLWSWRHALPNHLVEIQTDNIKHCKRANRMFIHVLSFPRLLSLLPNVSEKTFGQNIENLTHHQKHCHWKKSGDAQGHLMQCLCSEKRNYSFSSSKKAMILKTSLSLKAPSPQNRRACRSSSERCRWWGCTGESGWKLNHSDHLDIPLMRENRRREVGDEVWGGRSRPGKAPHLITRKRKVMILTIMMMIRNIQELVSESVDEMRMIGGDVGSNSQQE